MAGVMGLSAIASMPSTSLAHDRVVREYHSYSYESDDDDNDDDDWREHRGYRAGYDEPIEYRSTYYSDVRPRYEQRYRDRRYYDDCRTSGTTGAIIGGALGALIGRGVDRYGDRAAGTIIGAGGGALLGHEIDRKHRC